jgi:oxygen-dependent protoporphyrinogen oxidase
MARTVIVGGGISGLSLAFELQARGEDVLLLEARARLGGNVHTRQVDGFLLEEGPNAFLGGEPATGALIEQLGLTGRLRPAEPSAKNRFLFRAGKLHAVPSAPPKLLGSSFLPLGARLRLLLEPFSSRGTEEDESLADFARRHLGKTATRIAVDAVQSGIHAGDPETLSAWAFPKLVELERTHRSLLLGLIREMKKKRAAGLSTKPAVLSTFDRGLQTLIDALVQRLGARARANAKVERVERTATGWRVHAGETFDCERLVLACAAETSARLLSPHAPDLSALLGEIPYAGIAVVQLAFPKSALSAPLDGFGFLVPEVEGRAVMGAIFVSSIFPFRAPSDQELVTCMVGGARHPERVALDDAELQRLASEDLKTAIGLGEPPRALAIFRWPRAIPQYVVGHRARVQKIEQGLAGLPGLFLAGNLLHGVGLNDCVRASAVLAEKLRPRP